MAKRQIEDLEEALGLIKRRVEAGSRMIHEGRGFLRVAGEMATTLEIINTLAEQDQNRKAFERDIEWPEEENADRSGATDSSVAAGGRDQDGGDGTL